MDWIRYTFEILSIDIADVDLGRIGVQPYDLPVADKEVAQANEIRRAAAFGAGKHCKSTKTRSSISYLAMADVAVEI